MPVQADISYHISNSSKFKTTIKMKTLKTITLAILGVVFAINFASAQNYKAPKIDATGKIMDKDGKHIGSVNSKGEIMDPMGMKIASVDAEGTLVDSKTGKKLGKTEKNGNFVPYFKETPDKNGMTTSAPMNGTCMVKDASGKVVAEVHENYKQFGACAIHCLQNHMKHDEVLDKTKSTTSTTYNCSMHPDMVSDKPGKCGKCGMDLMKK